MQLAPERAVLCAFALEYQAEAKKRVYREELEAQIRDKKDRARAERVDRMGYVPPPAGPLGGFASPPRQNDWQQQQQPQLEQQYYQPQQFAPQARQQPQYAPPPPQQAYAQQQQYAPPQQAYDQRMYDQAPMMGQQQGAGQYPGQFRQQGYGGAPGGYGGEAYEEVASPGARQANWAGPGVPGLQVRLAPTTASRVTRILYPLLASRIRCSPAAVFAARRPHPIAGRL